MLASNLHDDIDNAPQIPAFIGNASKRSRRESLSCYKWCYSCICEGVKYNSLCMVNRKIVHNYNATWTSTVKWHKMREKALLNEIIKCVTVGRSQKSMYIQQTTNRYDTNCRYTFSSQPVCLACCNHTSSAYQLLSRLKRRAFQGRKQVRQR